MRIQSFLLNNKNIERNSYIWNMTGSMLMAFQSVIMLMILTRILGLLDAGVFTIAYANANLFLTIGKYGMRYFQVSDVKKQFTFAEYRASRIISSVAMIAVAAMYTIYASATNDYSPEKTQIIIWMCLFKTVDALEDIYHGYYQQSNRLDVAAKSMTIRLAATIVVFGMGLLVLKNLLYALITATIVTTFLFLLFTRCTIPAFQMKTSKIDRNNLFTLLKVCFPLFAGSFLSFYIGNAPKYAIDAMLTDELQACYGFIAMPVFVIGLLNNFIFNPMLYHMSVLWAEGRIRNFIFKTMRQTGIVAALTIVCITGAYLLGIPVLSWLYNTDLSPYKAELLILLLGGGFLGLSGLLSALITIMRKQHILVWGYAAVAVLACLFSNNIVREYGMTGAAVFYTLLMGALCIIFAAMYIYGICSEKYSSHEQVS